MDRRKTQHISVFVRNFIRECNLEEGYTEYRVFEAWDELMAELTSGLYSIDRARELTASKSFREGILTCRMASSTIRMQLKMNSQKLTDRLNEKLGGKTVSGLIIS